VRPPSFFGYSFLDPSETRDYLPVSLSTSNKALDCAKAFSVDLSKCLDVSSVPSPPEMRASLSDNLSAHLMEDAYPC